MSAYAIAGVTTVLKNLTINFLGRLAAEGVIPGVIDATISAVSPSQAETLYQESNGINWFMHRTALNTGLSNSFMPSRNSSGQLRECAPLPLDLYYLVTAYGDGDMHAEVMLGHVLQLFHENPVIDRDAITAALAVTVPEDGEIVTALNNASIADHLEQIKLSIMHPDDDMLSKLWGALNAEYRPSFIVHASIVLIESRVPTQPGLPVQQYDVNVLPLSMPRIERVHPASNPAGVVVFGDDVVIRGENLSGEITRVRVGSNTLATPADFPAPQRRQITLPAASLTDVRSGVNAVQVIHDILLGIPPVPHSGFQSNVIGMIVHPIISGIVPNLTLTDGVLGGTIDFTVAPAVHRGQRVNLLMNNQGDPDAPGYNFSSDLVDSDIPVSAFQLNVNGVLSGNYYIRVQVDGAASQLSVDPLTGTINEPPIPL